MPDGPVVALALLLVGGALVGLYFYIEHRRHGRPRGRTREVARLPLFGTDMLATRGEDGSVHAAPEPEPGAARPPRRAAVPRATVPRPTPPASAAPVARPVDARPAPRPPQPAVDRPPAFAPAPSPVPTAAFAPLGAAPATALAADPADPALVNGETLRFAVADEGTLRFLPGRLEVSAGPDAGREVRFVAPPGGDGPVEITFGRTEGPPYRHIQLMARTVSRRHARMQLTDDHWSLQNLSATNPVVHNGRRLAADEEVPLLVDGDRIEMGEVVFVFHGR